MKTLRALLLLTLGLVFLSQAAMAQDALSAILPAPYANRVGSQLLYFWEDGANLGSRGSFQSFMTITNTNITNGVWVHFQIYSSNACAEVFDFVDYLTPGQRHIFDPKGIRGTLTLGLVGFATDGRYIMTATPVSTGGAPSAASLLAVSFNWLSGQIWVSDINKSATWMTNAVSRMGVDNLGGPLVDGTLLTGLFPGAHLQYIRPVIISVNSFFRTAGAGAVQAGVPFGNRITFFSWRDEYSNAQSMYRINPGSLTLNSFVFDNAENAFSVPPKGISCVTEYTIAPDTIGSSCSASSGLCSNGNFNDFLGAPLTSAVNNTGGWLRMRVSGYVAYQSLVGWFSQYLGTFGGGDYLIGAGRFGTPDITTTTNGAGVIVSLPPGTYTTP